MALSQADREILIRIDERTGSMAERLDVLTTKFDAHVEKDAEQFESLKKWRAYTNGIVAALLAIGGIFQWALKK